MKIYNCNQNRPYVFISFSHDNEAKVTADVEKLRELGCNVWIYTADMEAGNNIAQTNAIIRHPNCKAVIFYMCEKSVCSKYCQEELKHAKKFSIPIIPVHCFTPVSGLEESIILLQRTMKNNDDIERSDWLIQEILKTSSGSEVISIPYDTPTHTEKLVQSIKSHCGDDVFGVSSNNNETIILPQNGTITETKDETNETTSAAIHMPAPEPSLVIKQESESAKQPTTPFPAVQTSQVTYQQSNGFQRQSHVQISPNGNKFLKNHKKPLIFVISGIALVVIIIGVTFFVPKNVTDKNWISGSYTGEWVHWKPNGKGTYIDNSKMYLYEGNFKNGILNGQGKSTLYYGNGTISFIEEGDFVGGDLDGKGKYTSYNENGTIRFIQEGDFVGGDLDGKGKYTLYNKNGTVHCVEEGDFVDGDLDGKGKYTLYNEDGSVVNVKEGTFKKGKLVESTAITETKENIEAKPSTAKATETKETYSVSEISKKLVNDTNTDNVINISKGISYQPNPNFDVNFKVTDESRSELNDDNVYDAVIITFELTNKDPTDIFIFDYEFVMASTSPGGKFRDFLKSDYELETDGTLKNSIYPIEIAQGKNIEVSLVYKVPKSCTDFTFAFSNVDGGVNAKSYFYYFELKSE